MSAYGVFRKGRRVADPYTMTSSDWDSLIWWGCIVILAEALAWALPLV